MLVTTATMLRKARAGQYAIGHFNTSDLEFTHAIIRAAEEANAPVIVATSKSAIAYGGYAPLGGLVRALAKEAKVPVALHLDHGPDMAHVKGCVKHGWTSIMRDASHLPFAKNIAETKKVVSYCKPHRIPVEAELGQLKGEEGWVKSKEHVFTDPDAAKEFVRKTGCSSLAVSIGTSHGAYKFDGTPRLDLKRLEAIADKVSIPLVLHGASSVPRNILKKAERLGAKLDGAHGVPTGQIQKAIARGIAKVNTDTDLRIGFDAAVRQFLKDKPKDFDPRAILGYARDQLQEQIVKRIDDLGSTGRA